MCDKSDAKSIPHSGVQSKTRATVTIFQQSKGTSRKQKHFRFKLKEKGNCELIPYVGID